MRHDVDARRRLQGALAQILTNGRYPETTDAELARLAGASAEELRELYGDKESLLQVTAAAALSPLVDDVVDICDSPGDALAKLQAALGSAAMHLSRVPELTYVALAGSEAAGACALQRSEEFVGPLRVLAERWLLAAGRSPRSAALTARALLAGSARAIQEEIQSGHAALSPNTRVSLLRWLGSYWAPYSPLPAPARATAEVQTEQPFPNARNRMLRVTARLASQMPAGSLTEARIARLAGASEEDFHREFNGVAEAILVCHERSTRRALGAALASFQAAPTWELGIRAAVGTLLETIASAPDFAATAVLAAPTLSVAAREQVAIRNEAFAAMLDHGFSVAGRPYDPLVESALIGGFWAVLRAELLSGRATMLPGLAADLSAFVLTPFLGAHRAARVAEGAIEHQRRG